jgi:SAM-dependent methyltransferase
MPGTSPDVRTRLRHLRRRASSQRAVWRRALPTEVAFWAEWIRTRGGEFPEDFRRRFNPQEPLREPLILDALERIEADEVRLLDVGAGPATWLGKTHPAKRLHITAVDPLAEEYDRLLDEAGLAPPVRTMALPGERLRSAFAPSSFDIAYARNALDHSADPLLIIRQMAEVVRPGGLVLLRHYENEAQVMGYEELHQWNFAAHEGRLLVSNERSRVDVGAELAGLVDVRASVEEGPDHAPWVTAVLARKGAER